MTLELEDAKIAQPVRDTLDLALCPDGCGGRVCARCGHPPAQHYSERDRKRGTPEAVGSCALCLVLRGVASSCLSCIADPAQMRRVLAGRRPGEGA